MAGGRSVITGRATATDTDRASHHRSRVFGSAPSERAKIDRAGQLLTKRGSSAGQGLLPLAVSMIFIEYRYASQSEFLSIHR